MFSNTSGGIFGPLHKQTDRFRYRPTATRMRSPCRRGGFPAKSSSTSRADSSSTCRGCSPASGLSGRSRPPHRPAGVRGIGKRHHRAQQLGKLLHGVWEAFLVSAAAIALAMAITLIEADRHPVVRQGRRSCNFSMRSPTAARAKNIWSGWSGIGSSPNRIASLIKDELNIIRRTRGKRSRQPIPPQRPWESHRQRYQETA